MLKLDNTIHLNPKEFSGDKTAYKIAKAVSAFAEKRRAEYREKEKPIPGMLGGTFYYSETVPWYEWMEETDVLGSCADSIGMSMVDMADAIANRIQPPNWKIFSLMALALKWHEGGRSLATYKKKVEAEREKKRKVLIEKGKNSGKKRTAKAKASLEKVKRVYDKLVQARRPRREIAGVIAQRLGVTADFVRKQLRKIKKQD